MSRHREVVLVVSCSSLLAAFAAVGCATDSGAPPSAGAPAAAPAAVPAGTPAQAAVAPAGPCAQAETCCMAFLQALPASGVTAQVCAGMRSAALAGPAAHPGCEQAMAGWRQALSAGGQAVPAACGGSGGGQTVAAPGAPASTTAVATVNPVSTPGGNPCLQAVACCGALSRAMPSHVTPEMCGGLSRAAAAGPDAFESCQEALGTWRGALAEQQMAVPADCAPGVATTVAQPPTPTATSPGAQAAGPAAATAPAAAPAPAGLGGQASPASGSGPVLPLPGLPAVATEGTAWEPVTLAWDTFKALLIATQPVSRGTRQGYREVTWRSRRVLDLPFLFRRGGVELIDKPAFWRPEAGRVVLAVPYLLFGAHGGLGTAFYGFAGGGVQYMAHFDERSESACPPYDGLGRSDDGTEIRLVVGCLDYGGSLRTARLRNGQIAMEERGIPGTE